MQRHVTDHNKGSNATETYAEAKLELDVVWVVEVAAVWTPPSFADESDRADETEATLGGRRRCNSE